MLKFPGLGDALSSLRPGAVWSCGSDYESIQWLDQVQTKPTREEAETELARLIDVYNNTEYQRLRKRAYPAWDQQMDILFNEGYDGWKAVIQAVKDQYPKPTE
jgi:hypothetical protein